MSIDSQRHILRFIRAQILLMFSWFIGAVLPRTQKDWVPCQVGSLGTKKSGSFSFLPVIYAACCYFLIILFNIFGDLVLRIKDEVDHAGELNLTLSNLDLHCTKEVWIFGTYDETMA